LCLELFVILESGGVRVRVIQQLPNVIWGGGGLNTKVEKPRILLKFLLMRHQPSLEDDIEAGPIGEQLEVVVQNHQAVSKGDSPPELREYEGEKTREEE
jgi:hypothetical protein